MVDLIKEYDHFSMPLIDSLVQSSEAIAYSTNLERIFLKTMYTKDGVFARPAKGIPNYIGQFVGTQFETKNEGLKYLMSLIVKENEPLEYFSIEKDKEKFREDSLLLIPGLSHTFYKNLDNTNAHLGNFILTTKIEQTDPFFFKNNKIISPLVSIQQMAILHFETSYERLKIYSNLFIENDLDFKLRDELIERERLIESYNKHVGIKYEQMDIFEKAQIAIKEELSFLDRKINLQKKILDLNLLKNENFAENYDELQDLKKEFIKYEANHFRNKSKIQAAIDIMSVSEYFKYKEKDNIILLWNFFPRFANFLQFNKINNYGYDFYDNYDNNPIVEMRREALRKRVDSFVFKEKEDNFFFKNRKNIKLWVAGSVTFISIFIAFFYK